MPQHAREYIKSLIVQRKSSDPSFSVQKMCDDLNLPKSTMDKFLSGQTLDTSYNNVALTVAYLGGSLDHLAGIRREEARAEAAQELKRAEPPSSSSAPADYPALVLLVESHEKELRRIEEHHTAEVQRLNQLHADHLDRLARQADSARDSLVSHHTSAYAALSSACENTVSQIRSYLDAAIRGRNFWRVLSVSLIVVLIATAIFIVLEFSDLRSGLTGQLLRSAGLIP